jgi:hypothetical protein
VQTEQGSRNGETRQGGDPDGLSSNRANNRLNHHGTERLSKAAEFQYRAAGLL